MSHQTFAIISCTVNYEDQFLLLKNEAGEPHFYSWTDRAMNGSHRWGYFDKSFRESFKISEKEYGGFRRELISMDNSGPHPTLFFSLSQVLAARRRQRLSAQNAKA